MTTETRFPILIDDDGQEDVAGTLSVKVTDEGIICDVEAEDGTVLATWACMAQDMADEYCH